MSKHEETKLDEKNEKAWQLADSWFRKPWFKLTPDMHYHQKFKQMQAESGAFAEVVCKHYTKPESLEEWMRLANEALHANRTFSHAVLRAIEATAQAKEESLVGRLSVLFDAATKPPDYNSQADLLDPSAAIVAKTGKNTLDGNVLWCVSKRLDIPMKSVCDVMANSEKELNGNRGHDSRNYLAGQVRVGAPPTKYSEIFVLQKISPSRAVDGAYRLEGDMEDGRFWTEMIQSDDILKVTLSEVSSLLEERHAVAGDNQGNVDATKVAAWCRVINSETGHHMTIEDVRNAYRDVLTKWFGSEKNYSSRHAFAKRFAADSEVIVFSTNVLGWHSNYGGALNALLYSGAKLRKVGLAGASYALPMMDKLGRPLPFSVIEGNIREFIAIAASSNRPFRMRKNVFKIQESADYTLKQMHEAFKDVPANVIMPTAINATFSNEI